MMERKLIYKIISCITAIFFVHAINCNIFAAIVSDNDGSAFITKAEFDSLKLNFQNQINSYNLSIDNKIDGAIAAYLAGINVSKVEKKPFCDGLGKNILITNSSNINDMVPGQIGIDWTWWLIYGTGAGYRDTGSTTVNAAFKRDSTDSVEMLTVDEKSNTEYIFNGYSKNGNVFCTVNGLKLVMGNYGQYTNPLSVRVCWHAGWDSGDAPADTLVKADWDEANIPNEYKKDCVYYCQNLSSPQFFGVASSINCHWNRIYSLVNNENTDGKNMFYDTFVNLNQNTILADYIMDSNIDNSSSVWSLLKPTAYDIVTEIQGKYNTTAVACWDFPNSSGNGITVNVQYYCDGKQNGSIAKYCETSWTNQVSGVFDPSKRFKSAKWYQLTLRQRDLAMENIYNDIDQSLKDSYSSFGYTGKISEGLPIMLTEKAGIITFDFDTTSLGKNAYIGFKTSAITEKGVGFESLARSAGINSIKIDGTEITGGSKLISNGKHSFSIELTNKNVPLFFKIAYPTTDTTTDRKVVTMPTELTFTSFD